MRMHRKIYLIIDIKTNKTLYSTSDYDDHSKRLKEMQETNQPVYVQEVNQ